MSVSDTELVALLSNLLSNALEASAAVSDPQVAVRIFPVRCYLCIEVKNRADLVALRSNPEMHSTKENTEYHGFGLSVIRDIAEKHEGTASFTVSDDGWFIAKITLLMEDL